MTHHRKFSIVISLLCFTVLLVSTNVGAAYGSTETLILFDDFDDPTLNSALWQFQRNGNGDYSINNGYLEIHSGTISGGGSWVFSNQLYTNLLFNGDVDIVILEARIRNSSNAGSWGFEGLNTNGTVKFFSIPNTTWVDAGILPREPGPSASETLYHINPTVEHVYRIELERTVTRYYVDGTLEATLPLAVVQDNPMHIEFSRISWGVEETLFVDYAKITTAKYPLNVSIDIKPGSDPNCFNNNGHGVIPVAILSSGDFDATQVDPGTVVLDGQGVRVVGKGNTQAHIEDVNSDGINDLVVQIEDIDGTYSEGDTMAILSGDTFDSISFEGMDTICIVP